MSDDRPSFRRRDAAPPGRGTGPLLVGLLLVVVLATALQWVWPDTVDQRVLVEVQGQVPSPGTYLVDEATVGEALRAAGSDVAVSNDDEPVPDGHRVRLSDGVAEVLPPSEPLLVGLPVDVNEAAVHELMAIPGLGPSTAGAIVAHRHAHGPFPNVDALVAVKGLGPSSLDDLRPFLVVHDPQPVAEPAPIDVNTADAATLERLPGVGPVMAARIVVDRDERGPYASLDELQRVHGIGPALVEGLTGLAVVTP